jgi:hypothetical protein
MGACSVVKWTTPVCETSSIRYSIVACHAIEFTGSIVA